MSGGGAPGHLDVVCPVNVHRCWRKLGPVDLHHGQNQRVRGDHLTVAGDNQLHSQIFDGTNQPASRGHQRRELQERQQHLRADVFVVPVGRCRERLRVSVHQVADDVEGHLPHTLGHCGSVQKFPQLLCQL